MLTSTTTIPAVTNEVRLDHNSVYSEMALLAKEVYGPQAPLTHEREPLTYETGYNPAYSENVGNAAVGRGWHKVSNLELEIPASDIGLSLNGLHYSLVNGFYQAYNDNDVIKSTNSPDIPEANALILKGIVGGKTTLAVVFRGTDQLADVTDYEDFVTQHYAKFAPLTNVLKEYATKGGFEQVLLDGHSLGAAMAQIFANDLSSNFPEQQIQLFTFGSPGAEKLAPGGVNQINFVNTHDIVPQSGLLSQNPDSTIAAANILSINSFLTGNILQLLFFQALASVASKTKPKFLSGATVLLNTSIGAFPSLSEHDLGGDKGGEINPEFPYINKAFNPGYINEVRKLSDYAADIDSPFYYTQFAKAINDGVAYNGTVPLINIGDGSYYDIQDPNNKDSVLSTYDGDEFVLGNQGVSNSIGFKPSKQPATLWNTFNSPTRIIDGGSIGDNISNELNLNPAFEWVLPTVNDLKTDSNGLKYYSLTGINQSGKVETANLYRINVINDVGLFQRTLDPSTLATHLNGKATTIQQAASGQSSLVVDGLSEVAYAGTGITSVTSNIDRAKIVFSSDTTNVTSSGVSTLIVSDGVTTNKSVTIDTGLASAFIYGGRRPTTFIGHLAGADFTGGVDSSLNTISYAGQTQDLLIDLTQGTATNGLTYDSFTNVSSVIAGQGNNYIVANSAANKFGGYNVAKSAATANTPSVTIVGKTVKNDIILGSDNLDTIDLSTFISSSISETRTDNNLVLGLNPNRSITVQDYYASNNRVNILFSDSAENFNNALILQPTIKLSKISDDIFNISNSIAKSKLQVTLTERSSNLVNELGVFTVDDAQGNIQGMAPGTAGYAQAALDRSKVIFSAITNLPNGFNINNLTHLLEFNSGNNLRFLLVKNGTIDSVQNGITPTTDILFSDLLSQKITDLGADGFSLAWKDGSNNNTDFKDLVVNIKSTNDSLPLGTNLQGTQQGEVLDLRGITNDVKADFVVNREAAFNNFVGFYKVADANGGIDVDGNGTIDFRPGDSGYAQAAIKNRVAGIDLRVDNQATGTFTDKTLTGGSIFAPFILTNGRTIDQVLNGQVDQAYFAYLGANTDKVDHIRLLGNNVFGFEDLVGGGDKDYNDIIVKVNLSVV